MSVHQEPQMIPPFANHPFILPQFNKFFMTPVDLKPDEGNFKTHFSFILQQNSHQSKLRIFYEEIKPSSNYHLLISLSINWYSFSLQSEIIASQSVWWWPRNLQSSGDEEWGAHGFLKMWREKSEINKIGFLKKKSHLSYLDDLFVYFKSPYHRDQTTKQ